MGYRLSILSFAILGSLNFSELSAEAPRPIPLDCDEFRTVLNFIESQHLRFLKATPDERQKFLKSAYENVPSALRAVGYPLLAAQFEKTQAGKISNFEPNSVCRQLRASMFRAAYLKAYARNLDPYSDFYFTEELDIKSSALDGEFIGVGIGTDPIEDYLLVTEVVEDGPAAGKIRVGDRILGIDHHQVSGLNETEIRQRIRGPLDSRVEFTGLRGKQKFTATVVRGRVHQRSVTWRWMEDKVLSIKIHRFFRQTAAEVEQVVNSFGGEARGFILDLRNNPGGLLQGARDVVDLFISQGVVVYLKGRSYDDQIWALRDQGVLEKPLVVLVNEGTASAAEIVAGALQDYGRAVLVGKKTYGKGSVQNIYETQGALGTRYRGGLKLTTLWYYLPSGRSVKSLDPDIVLPESVEVEHQTHPTMPYKGPDRIDVAQLPFNSFRHTVDKLKADSIVKNSKSSEEIGKALLLEMMALSN